MAENVIRTNDHLANERTFLAWIRTSISIIVFGFVVAKFSITLREFLLVEGINVKEDSISLGTGIGFVVAGILIALISMIRYRIAMHRIDAACFKPANLIIVVMSAITTLFGGALIYYLVHTAHSL